MAENLFTKQPKSYSQRIEQFLIFFVVLFFRSLLVERWNSFAGKNANTLHSIIMAYMAEAIVKWASATEKTKRSNSREQRKRKNRVQNSRTENIFVFCLPCTWMLVGVWAWVSKRARLFAIYSQYRIEKDAVAVSAATAILCSFGCAVHSSQLLFSTKRYAKFCTTEELGRGRCERRRRSSTRQQQQRKKLQMEKKNYTFENNCSRHMQKNLCSVYTLCKERERERGVRAGCVMWRTNLCVLHCLIYVIYDAIFLNLAPHNYKW